MNIEEIRECAREIERLSVELPIQSDDFTARVVQSRMNELKIALGLLGKSRMGRKRELQERLCISILEGLRYATMEPSDIERALAYIYPSNQGPHLRRDSRAPSESSRDVPTTLTVNRDSIRCICRRTDSTSTPMPLFKCHDCEKYQHCACYYVRKDPLLYAREQPLCDLCRSKSLGPPFVYIDSIVVRMYIDRPTLLQQSYTGRVSCKFSLSERLWTNGNLSSTPVATGTLQEGGVGMFIRFLTLPDMEVIPSQYIDPVIRINGSVIDLRAGRTAVLQDAALNAELTSMVHPGQNEITFRIDAKAIRRDAAVVHVIVAQIPFLEDLLRALIPQVLTEDEGRQCAAAYAKRMENDDVVCEDGATVSLRCQLSLMRIKCPVRGLICTHYQCFDFFSCASAYGLRNKESRFSCPICGENLCAGILILDGFFERMLRDAATDIDEALIRTDGSFEFIMHDDSDAGSVGDGAVPQSEIHQRAPPSAPVPPQPVRSTTQRNTPASESRDPPTSSHERGMNGRADSEPRQDSPRAEEESERNDLLDNLFADEHSASDDGHGTRQQPTVPGTQDDPILIE